MGGIKANHQRDWLFQHLRVSGKSGQGTGEGIGMITNSSKTQWQYLEKRPHPWRQQLYIKGRRVKASVIYSDMIVNEETPEEAAENWDLPLAAISEVIEYCQSHQELLKQEAAEERRIVLEGVTLEPPVTHR